VDGSAVGGNVIVEAAAGATTVASVGTTTIGGNLDVALPGDGNNVFAFDGTLKGTKIDFSAGNGANTVIFNEDPNVKDADASNATFTATFGSGKDTVILNSTKLGKLHLIDSGSANGGDTFDDFAGFTNYVIDHKADWTVVG